MKKPQRKLEQFAQSESNKTDSENPESTSNEGKSEQDGESVQKLTSSTDSEGTDEIVETENSVSKTTSIHDLSNTSDLEFGEDPSEINIPCKWARRYLAHRTAITLKKKPLSKNTVTSYTSYLREYVNFLHDFGQTVLDANFEFARKYLIHCISAGRASSTVKGNMSVMTELYKHIKLNEDVDSEISPIQFSQISTEAIAEHTKNSFERESLSQEELQKLFDSMDSERNRLMTIVGVETGFRNSDIRGIRIVDVDFEEPSIYAKDPKGSKPYTCPISQDLALEIEIWMDTDREANYGHLDSDYLFPGVNNKKLENNNSLNSIVKQAAEDAGIQSIIHTSVIQSKYLEKEEIVKEWHRVTPHALRHTFITILEDKGVSLEYRSLLANHSSPKTTQRYSHGKKELLKEAQNNINIL